MDLKVLAMHESDFSSKVELNWENEVKLRLRLRLSCRPEVVKPDS